MKVYFISGLAADETMFRRIHLPAPFEAVHLGWIPPHENEGLRDYALRLAEAIDTSERFAVVGLSFGGMIATEIGKEYLNAQVILISSIPMYAHLPAYFRWAGRIGLHRVVPVSWLKLGVRLKHFIFRDRAEDSEAIYAMIQNSDERFIHWALHAILSWENRTLPSRYFHVHGTRDAILPSRYTRPSLLVRGGGHLMVLERSEEVNKILLENLLPA